ncbi:MAG: TetR/AcrR family transcriptional regulator [Oscillospiraceae bacterium]|nr:TetR/AcrR family transcriptional regulator [Oscillospiraceae bacterium]
MPKPTFFRLPEEKRARLIKAAWDEFTRVSLSEASINSIIRAANIPRGSFYQYFEDKEDLFFYLPESLRGEYEAFMSQLLSDTRGDVFEACLLFFDALVTEEGVPAPRLAEVIRLFELNPELDFQLMLFGDSFFNELAEFQSLMNGSGYRKQDSAFRSGVNELLLSAMVCAVTGVLRGTKARNEIRNDLSEKIDIIKFGALASGKEEP